MDPTPPRAPEPSGEPSRPPGTLPGRVQGPKDTLPTEGATPEGALERLRTRRGIRAGVALPSGDPAWKPPEGPAAPGRYTFQGEIARGGMGAVVRILDNDIRRSVAMKVVLGDEDSSRLERFVEEAQITGQLEHPNIVPVHELGVNRQGKAYFTMKLVRGETLDAILDRVAEGDPEAGRSWPLTALLDVFLKTCDAVAFAHSRGVIHRDLKPENVMVGRFGEVLVMDWGLAKLARLPDPPDGPSAQTDLPDRLVPAGANDGASGQADSPDRGAGAGAKSDPSDPSDRSDRTAPGQPPATRASPGRTAEGEVMGTPSYMPPEQALGIPGKVDERSDVFSLGAILYRILTHEPPYDGASALEVLEQAARRLLAPPRARAPEKRIPPELESVCLRAMEADPARRYGSVEALAADVRAWLDRRPVRAHRYGPVSRSLLFVQRHPAASLAAGVALVMASLAFAAGGLLWAYAEASAARAREQEARAEAERGRAEAQALRAENAERERSAAVQRADGAEDLLLKSRAVAAVLRRAELELGDTRAALRRAFHGTATDGQRLGLSAAHWPRVEAFEASVPRDPASRAAWLALKGWLRRYAGDPEGALGLFRRARETDPDVAYGSLFEGMSLFARYLAGQEIPSIAMGPRGLEFGPLPQDTPALAEIRRDLEDVLARAGRANLWGESAAAEFLAVLEGVRALHAGQLEEAEEKLGRGLSIPELAWIQDDLLYARARVRHLRKTFGPGLEDVDRILQDTPGHLQALQIRGYLHGGAAVEAARRGGDPRPELRLAVETLSVFLDRIPAHLPMRNLRGSLRGILASAEADRGGDPFPLFDQALADLDRVLAANPAHPLALMNRGRIHLLRGEMELPRGRDPEESFRRALADCEGALWMEPGGAMQRTNRGNARLRLALAVARRGAPADDLLDGAIADYEEVLRLEPDAEDSLGNLAAARTTRGGLRAARGEDPRDDLAKAVELYGGLLSRNPARNDLRVNRGVALQNIGDIAAARGEDPLPAYRDAIRDFEDALKADPGAWIAMLQGGMTIEKVARRRSAAGEDPRDEFRRALALYEEVVRLRPELPDGHAVRGYAMYQIACAGQDRKENGTELFEKAVASYEVTLRIQPGRGQIHLFKGSALEELGRLEEALEAYEKAVKLLPEGYRGLPEAIAGIRRTLAGPAWNVTRARAEAAARRWDGAAARTLFLRSLEEAEKAGALASPEAREPLAKACVALATFEALLSGGRDAPAAEPKALAPAEAEALRAASIGHLRRAFELGWADPGALRKEPLLGPVLELPAGKALLEEMGGKGSGK